MNLAIIDQGPEDWTSFFRCSGVWAYLAKEHGINLIRENKDGWHWQKLLQCDAMFIHRPWNEAHVRVAEQCRTLKVPLWLDYDDNLFAMERSNQAYPMIARQGVQDNLRKLKSLADVVTVTTEALTEVYPGAVVIPNALNDYLWPLGEVREPKRVISWRGGGSHTSDIEPFLPALKSVAHDFPDWDWHFFGDAHWRIEEFIPNDQLHRHEFTDLFSYMQNLAAVRPAVHIVPLADNPFNRCKSNLSWIEATWAGAVTIAPSSTEWVYPGIITYPDVRSFESRLRTFLGLIDTGHVNINSQRSRECVSENLLLSQVNRERFELLQSFVATEKSGLAALVSNAT